MWYNIYGKRKGVITMEKVIRICEITGRVTTIATNITTEEAIALVKECAKDDAFATYRRVICG